MKKNETITAEIITACDLEEVKTLVSGMSVLMDGLLLLIEEEGAPTDLDDARGLLAAQSHKAVDKINDLMNILQNTAAGTC